ncbi:MAG: hypothetical protein P8075_16895 [Deltaproteobacteria bacterium]|jgi:hypothetical protein
MEEFLDTLWFKIEVSIHYLRGFLDVLFTPLNSLGPAVAIATIALITVIITKYFTKKFKTKRYRELREKFVHWYNVRQEAIKCEDYEKGKLLAKHIDEAKLNRVYYDYFLEGLLNNILTMYLPILLLLAYVNEAYSTSNLLKLFGRDYIFKLQNFGGEQFAVGAAFWFVLSILLVHLGWFIVKRMHSTITARKTKADTHYTPSAHPLEGYHDAG